MQPILGTYRDGHIELDVPVTWPEGLKVEIAPTDQSGSPPQTLGLDERTWVETPENRAALIASMEAYEPPEMTEKEWEEWQAARQAVKEYTLEKMRTSKVFDP